VQRGCIRLARQRMYLHDRSSGSTKPKEKYNYCRWRRNTTKFLKTAAKMKKKCNIIYSRAEGKRAKFLPPAARAARAQLQQLCGRSAATFARTNDRLSSIAYNSNLIDVFHFHILRTYNVIGPWQVAAGHCFYPRSDC